MRSLLDSRQRIRLFNLFKRQVASAQEVEKQRIAAAGRRRAAAQDKIAISLLEGAGRAHPSFQALNGRSIGYRRSPGLFLGQLPAFSDEPMENNETLTRKLFVLARPVVLAEVPAERCVRLSSFFTRHGPIITKIVKPSCIINA